MGFPTKELQSAARIILALSTKIPHWQPLHRACPLALLFVIFARGGSILRLRLWNIRFDGKLLWPCILLGTSPALMQLTENLVAISFNTSLQTYGGDMAVASMSVLSSVMQFVMLLLPGVVQGAQPLLSYNLGAENIPRVKRTFRLLLICCVSGSFLIWLLCTTAPMFYAYYRKLK